MSMLQILYMSHVVGDFGSAELLEMAETFRDFNEQHDISGLLFKEGDCFVQVLEGPEPEVRRLFERIAQDPRHRHVLSLLDHEVAVREFPDWGMVSTEVLSADREAQPWLRTLTELTTPEEGREVSGLAHGFLLALRNRIRAAKA